MKTKVKKESKRSSTKCDCEDGLNPLNISMLTNIPGMVGQYCNKCYHVLSWDFGTYQEVAENIKEEIQQEVREKLKDLDDNVVFTLPDPVEANTSDLSTICVQVIKLLAISDDPTSMGFYVTINGNSTVLTVPSTEKKVKNALSKPDLIEGKWATIEVFGWEDGIPTNFEVKSVKARKS